MSLSGPFTKKKEGKTERKEGRRKEKRIEGMKEGRKGAVSYIL